MIEPDLKAVARAICCPEKNKRCIGECAHANEHHYHQANSVRQEYRDANRPKLKE
jgi:hypothetical protein